MAASAAVTIAALARAQADPRFEEYALVSVPHGIDVQCGVEFASDGSRVAYVGRKDGKSLPVIDAKAFDARDSA